MIPFPFQFGGFGNSLPLGNTISFINSTAVTIYASGTSISGTSMSGILNGDGLFAVIMARSTVTPPAGWTLLKTVTATGSGINQVTEIYRKDTVTSADSSTAFAFTQASSNRGIIGFVQLRSSTGSMSVDADASTGTNNGTSTPHPANVPTAVTSATVNNAMAIIGASLIVISISGTTTWTAPTNATLRGTTTTSQNRLGIATQPLNVGVSNNTPFVVTSSDIVGVQYSGAVTVIIKAS